jgi:hypothetical protein
VPINADPHIIQEQAAMTKYAAYDDLAIYAIGDTPEAAIEKARDDAREPEARFETAPIRAAFAAYIEEHGWGGSLRTFGKDGDGFLIDDTDDPILQARDNAGAPALIDGIKHLFNCREADVTDGGDVWICDPQAGYWFDADGLAYVAREAGDI